MYLKVLSLGGLVGFFTGDLTWIGYLLFGPPGSETALGLAGLSLIFGLVLTFKKYKFKGSACFLPPWVVGFCVGCFVLGPRMVGHFHHWTR